MKQLKYIKRSVFFIGLFQGMLSFAGTPQCSITPLTVTTVSLSAKGSAIVSYKVTNETNRTYTFVMTAIDGVSQTTTDAGVCDNPFTLKAHDSCTLSLQITGSLVAGSSNTEGPEICVQGGASRCYKPVADSMLKIKLR